MAQGQGRSSKQGVKLLYIRDYLYTHTNKDNPKNAKHIVGYLASKGIAAKEKTIYNDILRLQIDFGVPVEYNPKKWGYPAFKNKQLNVSELARVCDLSRTTVYKYIDLLEGRAY